MYKQSNLLVSVDNNSGWPDAMFLPNPLAEKVVEFLLEYIATNGIPKGLEQIRGQCSRAKNFSNFVKKDLSNM